jgi:hypothetical protein
MENSMMRWKFLGLFLVMISVGFIAQASSQDRQKSQILVLNEYKVKPDKVSQFESVMKSFVSEMEKDDCPYELIMHSTSHFTYYSMWHLDDYSMMDKFDAYWAGLSEKIGALTMDKYHKLEFGAIDSFNIKLLKYRPGLSYNPDKPEVAEDEVNFVHWQFYYIDPAKRREWAVLQKRWLKLYQKKNISMPFRVYTGNIGYERPVWIYLRGAKSRTDYFNEAEKASALLGKAKDDLINESLPLMKRVEEKFCFYRRDLSYIPEN